MAGTSQCLPSDKKVVIRLTLTFPFWARARTQFHILHFASCYPRDDAFPGSAQGAGPWDQVSHRKGSVSLGEGHWLRSFLFCFSMFLLLRLFLERAGTTAVIGHSVL